MKNTILALVLIACMVAMASAWIPSNGKCYHWKKCSSYRRCGWGKYCDYRYGYYGYCCSRYRGYDSYGGNGGYGHDNYDYPDQYY